MWTMSKPGKKAPTTGNETLFGFTTNFIAQFLFIQNKIFFAQSIKREYYAHYNACCVQCFPIFGHPSTSSNNLKMNYTCGCWRWSWWWQFNWTHPYIHFVWMCFFLDEFMHVKYVFRKPFAMRTESFVISNFFVLKIPKLKEQWILSL